MWLELAVGVIGVWLIWFLYSKYLESQRDVHELALNAQSNSSPTRKEDESAIYRSNQTPHGMPLVTGLQIRQGFRIRNGNLKDVWSVVMNQKQKESRLIFYENGEEINCDLDNLNAIFKRLVQFFVHNDCYKIGITVPLHKFQSVVSCLACWSHGLTIHCFDQLPRQQPDIDLMIVDESQLQHALRLKYKKVLVIAKDPSKSFQEEHVLNWSELGDLTSLKDSTFEYKYDAKYDENIPLINTTNFATHSYTHQNFVSAMATVARLFPLGHELTDQERLLIGYKTSTINYWPKILITLLMGGSVVVGSTSDSSFNEAILTYKPTLLSIDGQSARRWLIPKVQPNWFESLKIQRCLHLMSEGIFTTSCMDPDYTPLRLIFVDNTDKSLSNSEVSLIRVLLGTRIIQERWLQGVIGSILNTNFYDYRIFSNDKLANKGACSLSLEIKVFRYKNLNIEKRHGELCLRGFTVGKPEEKALPKAMQDGERVGSEGWVPTGVIGKFGNDGCFYED